MIVRAARIAVVVGLALSTLAVLPPSASAQTAPSGGAAPRSIVSADVMSRVEQALRAIDSTVPAAFWERLGAQGLAALALILDDGARPVGLRRRAVSAVGHYRSPTARDLLTALARSRGEDEIVSRYAVVALGRAFGLTALDEVLASLVDERALVREGAVLSLGRLRASAPAPEDERIRAALTLARSTETERFVLVAIEATLAPSR